MLYHGFVAFCWYALTKQCMFFFWSEIRNLCFEAFRSHGIADVPDAEGDADASSALFHVGKGDSAIERDEESVAKSVKLLDIVNSGVVRAV